MQTDITNAGIRTRTLQMEAYTHVHDECRQTQTLYTQKKNMAYTHVHDECRHRHTLYTRIMNAVTYTYVADSANAKTFSS